MDKTTKLLGGLLAAQALLALWAFSGGSDLAAHRPDEPLLTFEPAEVTGIKVEGSEGAEVSLDKGDDGWILPDAWKVPAKGDKVAHLLKRVQKLKKGLAVATTAGAKERFEVSDAKFQRRITLSKGEDTLVTLYLGTSPGVRKIHARTLNDDAVYSVSFAAYEAPDKPDDWLDSGLLRLEESELEAIELDGLTLVKPKDEEKGAADSGWTAVGLASSESVDVAKARDLALRLSQLDVRKVLGTEAKPDYKQDAPALQLRLRRSGTEPVTWILSKPEKGDDYVLKSTDHPWYFDVASWAAKPLLEVAKRDALVISTEQPDENEAPVIAGPEDAGQTPEEATDQSKPAD